MKPNSLFLFTAFICASYIIIERFKGNQPDEVFWAALITIFFSIGAWYFRRGEEEKMKQN